MYTYLKFYSNFSKYSHFCTTMSSSYFSASPSPTQNPSGVQDTIFNVQRIVFSIGTVSNNSMFFVYTYILNASGLRVSNAKAGNEITVQNAACMSNVLNKLVALRLLSGKNVLSQRIVVEVETLLTSSEISQFYASCLEFIPSTQFSLFDRPDFLCQFVPSDALISDFNSLSNPQVMDKFISDLFSTNSVLSNAGFARTNFISFMSKVTLPTLMIFPNGPGSLQTCYPGHNFDWESHPTQLLFYVLFKPHISGPLNLFVTLAGLHGRMTHDSAALNSYMLSKLTGYYFRLFTVDTLRKLERTQIPVAKVDLRDGQPPLPIPALEVPDTPGPGTPGPALDLTDDLTPPPTT